MRHTVILLILSIASPFLAFARTDWMSKDFDKWDAKDVETILNNSAWVKKQEVRLQYEPTMQAAAGSVVLDVGINRGGVANSVTQGSIAPAVDFTFTARLRSSLAIRLALIRRNQIEIDVNKLIPSEREFFHRKQRGLYECPACAENYVITLTSQSKENRNFDAVFTAFARAQLDDIKRYIYLQDETGKKRELVFFTPPKAPGEEAVFFFRRFDENGKELFTKESKFLIFNTTNNNINTATNFRFEIAPLIVGGKVQF